MAAAQAHPKKAIWAATARSTVSRSRCSRGSIEDSSLDALDNASRAGYRKVNVNQRFWEAIIPIDVRFYRALRDGALDASHQDLVRDYRDTMKVQQASKTEIESVIKAMEDMAALTANKKCPPGLRKQAAAIQALAKELRDGMGR